jgi:hypothetical protein
MKRILRGAVVFAASALVWACNTEPEVVQGGDPVAIVADPAVVLVPQFGTEEVLVRLVDQQGQSLETEIAVSATGTGIEVTSDPLYRPVYAPDGSLTANTANTELRLEVEGLALGTTTFTVTGEGLSEEVTVTVVPADVEATFLPAAPNAGDTVTVTLPAGLRLGAGFTFTSLRGDNPIFVDVPLDSLSARIIMPANAAQGDLVVNGVRTIFNPAAGAFNALPLRTVPAAPTGSLYAGSGACATAPVLAAPTAFWDLPPVEGTSERFYKVTVPGGTNLSAAVQPSPSNGAVHVQIVDAATCAVVLAEAVLPVVEGTRTAATAIAGPAGLAAGTYGVRVSTQTILLPNGDPSPVVGSIKVTLTLPVAVTPAP